MEYGGTTELPENRWELTEVPRYVRGGTIDRGHGVPRPPKTSLTEVLSQI